MQRQPLLVIRVTAVSRSAFCLCHPSERNAWDSGHSLPLSAAQLCGRWWRVRSRRCRW